MFISHALQSCLLLADAYGNRRNGIAQAGYEIRLDSWDTSATYAAATAAMVAEQRGIMNICLTYNPGSSPTVNTAGHALQTLIQQPLQQQMLHQQQAGQLALPGTAVT